MNQEEQLITDIKSLLECIDKVAHAIPGTPTSEVLAALGSALMAMDSEDDILSLSANKMLHAMKVVADVSEFTYFRSAKQINK
jgi:hypothetical protein